MFWWGTEGEYNIMVMELLGKTLQTCFGEANHLFSLKTVYMLAIQMVIFYIIIGSTNSIYA